MKTASIGIENLCVPCHASCKYCLLSSCHKATGVGYERGKRFARRLYETMREQRPDLHMFHYIGYCMDSPDLWDYICFSREIGSPAGKFLQLNGLAFRDQQETERFIQRVKEEGIESIDLTFYGTREYHDHFAGRTGDFDFLLRILAAANKVGLKTDVSFPLTRENLLQADELLDMLAAYQLGRVYIFLPHSKGRGQVLDGQRLTRAEFDSLSHRVKSHFSKIPHLTEGEWIEKANWGAAESRTLTLCLTPDNIDELEAMTLEEIIRYLEGIDDEYDAKMPSIGVLAEQYGVKTSDRMFRIRDLHLKWQKMYLQDLPDIYDMNDETHHFSIRT